MSSNIAHEKLVVPANEYTIFFFFFLTQGSSGYMNTNVDKVMDRTTHRPDVARAPQLQQLL